MAHIITVFRTPIRKRFGALKEETAIDLMVPLVQRTLRITTKIDEFILGCSIQANIGQNMAKQILFKCPIKTSLPTVCFQVNKVCASGIKALDLAINSILLGKSNCVLVGGVESMSNMPTYNENVDSLIRDGLTCSISNKIMGDLADSIAEKYSISRKDLDDYALSSYKKYREAYENHFFEKCKVPIRDCKEDECFPFDEQKMKKLRPVFNQHGFHTSANSSKLADGGSVILLASSSFIKENGLHSLAEILASEDFENEPESFIEAPIGCITKLLKRSNLKKEEIHIFEINEAFAVVPILVGKQLHIPQEKINPCGGAIAFGHPLGASGLIILCHLVSYLEDQQFGCLSICNGGGGASGIIIRKNQYKFHKQIDLNGCRNPKIIEWNENQLIMVSSKKVKEEQGKIKYLLFKDILDENMEVIFISSFPLNLENIINGYLENMNISVWIRNLYVKENDYHMLIEIKKNIENKYFEADFLLIKTRDFLNFYLEIEYPYKNCFLFNLYNDIAFISEIDNLDNFIWGIYLFSFKIGNETIVPIFDKYVDYSKDKGHVMHGLLWDSKRKCHTILFSIRHEIEPKKHIYQIYSADTIDFKNFTNTRKLNVEHDTSQWFCYPFSFAFKGKEFMICNQDDFGKEKEPVVFEKIF